jgi:hypothetical protein
MVTLFPNPRSGSPYHGGLRRRHAVITVRVDFRAAAANRSHRNPELRHDLSVLNAIGEVLFDDLNIVFMCHERAYQANSARIDTVLNALFTGVVNYTHN